MKLHVIHSGNFKLDGGAMFGVVPKVIWNSLNPADEKNLCNWAMRCLLVEDGDRRILIDTGIGDKQSEKFFGYYYLNGPYSLVSSLKNIGLSYDDVTDVLLTHLHFDHVGGAVIKTNEGKLMPAFPNATYHVTETQWNHALKPNARERASFLPENFLPLQEAGVLNFVKHGELLTSHVRIRSVNGHTIGMITPEITINGKKVVYCADLIPSSAHIPVHYTMGYDIEPLVVMQEKELLYSEMDAANTLYFFEHDVAMECAKLQHNDRGQMVIAEKGNLSDLLA
ncbi:MAG: MBL fold metallo-hydrolase [Sphingomonadales bacterium]|jgi:glyoxylase-like metal-dependent hydrolase (beta-lactamase superfamily II)